jgi:hypothetical protein
MRFIILLSFCLLTSCSTIEKWINAPKPTGGGIDASFCQDKGIPSFAQNGRQGFFSDKYSPNGQLLCGRDGMVKF